MNSEETGHSVRRVWTESELDEALSNLHDDVTTDEQVLATARAAMLNSAGGQVTDVRQVRRADAAPRQRSMRRWLAAAAVVGVVTAGGLVAGSLSFGGDAPETPRAGAAVAATLERAAERASGADEPAAAEGQYRYVMERVSVVNSGSGDGGRSIFWRVEQVNETWAPHRESDEWLHRRTPDGEREWLVGSEEEARRAGLTFDDEHSDGEWKAPCGDWFSERPCEEPAGWHNPTPEWQASLPKDPGALYERLRDDAPENSRGDAELLVYAADALRSGVLGKEVRAALYEALTKVPGLEITEEEATLDGRVGTALGIEDGTQRQEIIIDPDTGEFIGERTVLSEGNGDLPEGTVLSHSSVTTAVVDDAGDRPVE
ncbi:CU044_5270 family protein [Saccharomonospora xinjiangensis]|uniref:Uncharacterized protein n=1 Tax=Saccharomonospora xinjiangensis XJ-54 TaxID=882086 RepID=I0UXG2_9PSEU|nr:CU044_5270 family protein [Saccharomonospora xinjiangensis]EID52565.1 hypothetical protein SacxiDRAFT_0284 [Saccharomonospora xinjiangensis XJ-54]